MEVWRYGHAIPGPLGCLCMPRRILHSRDAKCASAWHGWGVRKSQRNLRGAGAQSPPTGLDRLSEASRRKASTLPACVAMACWEGRGGLELRSRFFVSLFHALILCHFFEKAFYDDFLFGWKFFHFFEENQQVSIFKICRHSISCLTFE